MDELYEKMMEHLCSAKPIGKRFAFYKGKVYSIDNNFNPPIVKEIRNGGQNEQV